MMKITPLGHASIIVEMDGAVGLMDSVFFDPFEEGAVVSCPKRMCLSSGCREPTCWSCLHVLAEATLMGTYQRRR